MTGSLHPLPGLRNLFPATVAVGMLPVSAENIGRLARLELELVQCAVPKRQQEFATGRVLARELLREIGAGVESIGRNEDRTPQWPAGVVGSISHCDEVCIAAVARLSDGYRSLGVDLEPAQPLPEELWDEVTRESERRPPLVGGISHGMFYRRVFSAKEAAFKCVYPVDGTVLGFHEMQIEYTDTLEEFGARGITPSSATNRRLAALDGRQAVLTSWIVSTVLWREPLAQSASCESR